MSIGRRERELMNQIAEKCVRSSLDPKSLDALLGKAYGSSCSGCKHDEPRLSLIYELICFESFLGMCLSGAIQDLGDIAQAPAFMARYIAKCAPGELIEAVLKQETAAGKETLSKFVRVTEERLSKYLKAAARDLGSEIGIFGNQVREVLAECECDGSNLDDALLADTLLSGLRQCIEQSQKRS